MLDSFIWLVGAIALAIPCLILIAVAVFGLIEFISLTVATWIFIGKGRVELTPGWSRVGAAMSLAKSRTYRGQFTYNSGNDWMVALHYSHPFKWHIDSAWDYIAADDEGQDDA